MADARDDAVDGTLGGVTAPAVDRVACLLPAAGLGTRLGPGTPKALRPVGGVPLLTRALRGVQAVGLVDLVVVAGPPGHLDAVAAALPDGLQAVLVEGGAERQHSVAAMLAVLPDTVEVVLVHDAARAFTPPEVFQRVLAAVRAGADAAVPAVPLADTVRRVGPDGLDAGLVDRSLLRAVQTPQGFRRDVLVRAHGLTSAQGAATDDASLVETLGGTVVLVEGHEEAFKVTRPSDLLLAQALAARDGR